ncbi:hypothetical protein O181_094332 [Austropuccinia psidii MF-1]|uniref:Uncharacterized protein n=1 Tax=Austropuccinia psidii MF-1 TaxID=1389203 RepID=A0A9Q3PBE9_9BASI|nr:hypothetical protein [Austropuccinia psidii MF-1]
MDITLELDTRYHERQKEKGSHKQKKPPISGSNSSKPPQSSSSKKPYHRKNKKGNNFQVSKEKPHATLHTKDNKLIGSEKERRIEEALCNYCGGKHPFEKCFKRPENRQDSPKGEDLILGYIFLYHFNPIIDWKNGLITYDSSHKDSSHKDSSGIVSSSSNDFATAVNSVALVGELKTPSLPPSVHIPSSIPSQSLLPSRDEVFKEIKDVGEDVATSSLNLFQGDMDLPPLSFYASLEEQWDEEEEPEEIETVLKQVPPSYHQYLDVFSKVKADKLPPHHACDHHIELEGLLPPVGVIYSLSQNESETQRA